MKNKIRKDVLKLRQGLTPSQVRQKSLRIFERLENTDVFTGATSIMAYIAFRNEVDTLPIIRYCLSSGKKVIVPISKKKGRQLLLSELRDPDRELRPGTYGILEPLPQFIRPFPKEGLDLILVPAVAFDPSGYRIGYGAGYYDRFLGSLDKKIPAIGLAFELQLVDKVPAEPTDLPVDYIVTEDRIINCIDKRKQVDP